MPRFPEWIRYLDWLWFLAFGLASSAWCLTAAREVGTTFDETIYIVRGLDRWHTGSHEGLMRLGTMPLPVEVETYALYLRGCWLGRPLESANQWDSILAWARAGTLVFWWLLLWYGRRAGRHLAGPWGGRLAVALLACEPTLLAHAGLATTDIAISACLLALVYHFRAGRNSGWVRRVALPALWFGLALLSKGSALAFGPICLLAVEIERLIRSNFVRVPKPMTLGLKGCGRQVLGSILDGGQILLGGLSLAMLYCEGLLGGLLRQVFHNVQGHGGSYLLGHGIADSFWYYFPVALTIKLSASLLVLFLLVLVLRGRSLMNWACVAAGALLAFSVTCRVQIGIRLVLPLVALAMVGLAGALVQSWREISVGWRRMVLMGGAALGVAWASWSAVAVWPNGLCYTNEFWGGTAQGYRCLSDSNYDWGQGLNELAGWQRDHGIANLDVWYFGTDPRIFWLPMRRLSLHEQRTQNDVLALVRGHYLAVGASMLYGPNSEHVEACSLLYARQPTARTSTFFIYDFTK